MHNLPCCNCLPLIQVKNIVLTGFGHITLLDLDTIDLSNLNRQFLFRKKDVKQPKSLVR
jgi:ubiquitin-like 1-activating enzyme E1 B